MIDAYRVPFQIEGNTVSVTIGRTDSFMDILRKINAFVSKRIPDTLLALPVPSNAPISNLITCENAHLFTDYFKKRSNSESVILKYIDDINASSLGEGHDVVMLEVFQVVKAFGKEGEVWYCAVDR